MVADRLLASLPLGRWELTWLLLHEPIRNSLLEMQELVINTPGFDPVQFPWKVTNFFIFFNKCFAPYVRRHHEAEEKVSVVEQLPACLPAS